MGRPGGTLGTVVTVRPARPADEPALAALYGALSDQSYLRRFLSLARDEATLARLARLPVDGLALVAVDAGQLVAEARYEGSPVPELGLTVRDDRQGRGLGRTLLEALRARAADTGLAALRAVVRTDNAPMLRLLRAVGCVTCEPTELGLVTLLVATDDAMPGWPATGPQRVLVEGRGWWDDPYTAELRAAGHDVRICPGPGPRRACPLVTSGACRIAADADLIVHRLPDAVGADVLDAHRQRWPDRLGTRT